MLLGDQYIRINDNASSAYEADDSWCHPCTVSAAQRSYSEGTGFAGMPNDCT